MGSQINVMVRQQGEDRAVLQARVQAGRRTFPSPTNLYCRETQAGLQVFWL